MTDFTPGPWKVASSGTRVIDHDGRFIAECGPEHLNNAENDARLVAAAPDLLAALVRLVDVCTHANKGAFDNGITGQNGYPDEGDVHAWSVIDQAEKAMRAARGEAVASS